ncbi:MAG: hypothetical protein KF709_10915 [Gemmatimonadaceae bacterium]|nr:hypothetical protein [Gemmatimonadaceae bacterium]
MLDFEGDALEGSRLEVDLWLSTAVTSRRAAYPFEVKLILRPGDGTRALGSFSTITIECFAQLRASYGFIHRARTYAEAQMELDAIPSSLLGSEPSDDEREHWAWLGFWQRYRHEVGDYVRTAYLGNLLGSALVDRLGGLSTLQAEAPAAVIEAIPSGGVYLQAEVEGDWVSRDSIDSLARYLRHVSLEAQHPEFAPTRGS